MVAVTPQQTNLLDGLVGEGKLAGRRLITRNQFFG
jgi:hypothetical protein